MKFSTCLGLTLTMLVLVAGSFVAQAEQFKGDKYHGRIESTMANMLVLLTDGDELIEFIVPDDATITKDAQPSSRDELAAGDAALVKARRSNGRLLAVRISAMTLE